MYTTYILLCELEEKNKKIQHPSFSRTQSHVSSSLQVKYKEAFEKMKGQSLFVPGAELIHSKNISAVISEVWAQSLLYTSTSIS